MDFNSFKIILASKSPRRQALIKELGFPFEIRSADIAEIYPDDLVPEYIPRYLAELKAKPFEGSIREGEVLLTSDTIVLLDNQPIGKPKDSDDAREMLQALSGKTHTVVTGVCLTSTEKKSTFSELTKVHFNELSNEEIRYYVDTFKPMDKAGSYAIQEWIGYIGVRGIEGCYYNVMGLPLNRLYHELTPFLR